MVRAWYMDDSDVDQRLEHRKKSSELLSTKDLYAITGVEHFKVDHEHHLSDTTLKELKENRGFTYDGDIICSQGCYGFYEDKLHDFHMTRLHTDEEIRLVLDGSSYFELRVNDQWICIEVYAGDLIIVPSGIYHRFLTGSKGYIKAEQYVIREPQ